MKSRPTIQYLKKWRTPLAFAPLAIAIITSAAFMPGKANAGKIFADQTGLGCATCHSAQGMANGSMRPLTPFGISFRNNGYRLPPSCQPRQYQLINPDGSSAGSFYGCVQ